MKRASIAHVREDGVEHTLDEHLRCVGNKKAFAARRFGGRGGGSVLSRVAKAG
jgi:hypothetical protein